MIKHIRAACQRLEALPFYRQMVSPPRLWVRLWLSVGIAGGALALAQASTPVARTLFRQAGMAALLFTPSVVAALTVARIRQELSSESFKLVSIATPNPTTLVDSFAGATLHALWPVWLTALTLTALLGGTVEGVQAGIGVGMAAWLVTATGTWFGVWAGLTAAFQHEGLPRAVLSALVRANLNATIGLAGVLSIVLLTTLIAYAVLALLAALVARVTGTTSTVIEVVLIFSGLAFGVRLYGRLVRSIFRGMRQWAIIMMDNMLQ